jgi:hypothetical protein
MFRFAPESGHPNVGLSADRHSFLTAEMCEKMFADAIQDKSRSGVNY